MIGIVDYGMGNLLSVCSALEYLGAEARLCGDPEALGQAERIVLPGVGAFADCMRNLRDRGFLEALQTLVVGKGRPMLGICLGMQTVSLGQRFHTSSAQLDAAMTFDASCDADGLREEVPGD